MILKILMIVFGMIFGFVAGAFFTHHIVGGGIFAIIGGAIFKGIASRFGKSAVKAEAESLSGEKRSVWKTLFWWFILFIFAAVAIILKGLGN